MTKKRIPALKIEDIHDKGNLKILSLVEYKRDNYLCIVDSINPNTIGAYVLDYAEQENIPVNHFISIAIRWFYSKSEHHPLSVEIAKLGLTETLSPIYRTFDASYVSRIVGNAFTFEGMNKSKVKRRRVVPISEGIEIRLKKPN
jgi:hypothetical protein